MAKRIDSLITGDKVRLRYNGSKSFGNEPWEEDVTFIGIVGSGDERRAQFDAVELYRFKGFWAYGTSAERASLV
jgi:hypothetical protein